MMRENNGGCPQSVLVRYADKADLDDRLTNGRR
jgi:hypothetical protein